MAWSFVYLHFVFSHKWDRPLQQQKCLSECDQDMAALGVGTMKSLPAYTDTHKYWLGELLYTTLSLMTFLSIFITQNLGVCIITFSAVIMERGAGFGGMWPLTVDDWKGKEITGTDGELVSVSLLFCTSLTVDGGSMSLGCWTLILLQQGKATNKRQDIH